VKHDVRNFVAGAPSLSELSYRLRHRDTWPPGFTWRYQDINHCAMALAYRTWPALLQTNGLRGFDAAFGLEPAQTDRIFGGVGRALGVAPADVTPEMVADLIDEVAR
jgi:hypothetical protein